ncbi:hypothetical protein SBC1_11990 [Caballeronia sp. SBC1]|nr:hypothetical protein SBC2_13400 [Caballeronia sp. SBC2]QIN61213.1 hypothetical protein SBC1_11990 [Caballeronia sp. SBC1]
MASMVACGIVFPSAASCGLKEWLRIVWQTSRLIADGSVPPYTPRIKQALWLPPLVDWVGLEKMAQVIGRALHGRVD